MRPTLCRNVSAANSADGSPHPDQHRQVSPTAPSPMGFSEHRHPKKKEFIWFLEERSQLRLCLVNKTPERFFGSRSPEGGKGGNRQKEGVQDTCSGTCWSPFMDVSLHCRSSWCPLNSSVATKKALTSWSLVLSQAARHVERTQLKPLCAQPTPSPSSASLKAAFVSSLS